MNVQLLLPTNGRVHWTMTFERPQGKAIVSDSLAPMDSPQDGSVRLTKPRRQPRTPGTATLGRLKRGIGDTLLLDIMPHVDFPSMSGRMGSYWSRYPRGAAAGNAARCESGDESPKPVTALKPATARS
jgi:hypothetical protein